MRRIAKGAFDIAADLRKELRGGLRDLAGRRDGVGGGEAYAAAQRAEAAALVAAEAPAPARFAGPAQRRRPLVCRGDRRVAGAEGADGRGGDAGAALEQVL